MPNIASAKKSVRYNAKKTTVNTLVVSSMRTAVKKFEKEVKAGNKEAASTNYNLSLIHIFNSLPQEEQYLLSFSILFPQ